MDIVKRKPSRAPWRRLAAGAALVGGVSLAVGTCWRTSAAAPAVDRSSMWTEKVRRGELLRQVPVQGTLVPERVQWLSAGTAARVKRINVQRGAEVEADTVVVVLENTDLELAAIEAERQAASAEARLIELDVRARLDRTAQAGALLGLQVDLRDAERHAAAAERLGSEGLVSDGERRDALARKAGLAEKLAVEEGRREALAEGHARQAAAQRAEIEQIKEMAAFRRRQIAALEVRAGIRGVVTDIPLENGQWVAVGTLLAKVAEPGRLKAEVKVADSYARDLHKGLAVRFEGAGPNGRGRIERIDPAVVLGSVRLEVRLDSVPPDARADQGVSGYVEIEKLEDVLFVARPANARDGAAAGVFRLDPDRTHASRVTVQLGRGSARDVEVVSGLREGDEIVVSDVSAWQASERVRLK